MRQTFLLCAALAGSTVTVFGQSAVTIYNQNFGVVRETIRLDLRQGANSIRFAGAPVHLEPASVVLRDPAGRRQIQIIEQTFRNDPLSQELLLSLYEGQTLQFEVTQFENGQPKKELVSGKIIRSGYVPQFGGTIDGVRQQSSPTAVSRQPVIEVDGKLRFSLPGTPLFPTLGDDTVVKPVLVWVIQSDRAGRLDAEMSYRTRGLNWEAQYNVLVPGTGDLLELVCWVIIDNQSGKSYDRAKLKLVAADASAFEAEKPGAAMDSRVQFARASTLSASGEAHFGAQHVYNLSRAVTLQDHETKQIELVRAAAIPSASVYVYDGAVISPQHRHWSQAGIRHEPGYGAQSQPHVQWVREFENSEANQLGLPLPQGGVRVYRRDADGVLELVGEHHINHVSRGGTLRVFTGNAADLQGARRQTSFKVDERGRGAEESFEVQLRNRRKDPVEIRVVEHLYRGSKWEIVARSDAFTRLDGQRVEFRVSVEPEQERTLTYKVRYAW